MLPQFTWRVPGTAKSLYLTFDDGPVPEATEYVLDELARFGVKGTFFCVGDNLHKHPDLGQRVLAEGHRMGNHTYNHLPGWSTPTKAYLDNVARCEQAIQSLPGAVSGIPLMRPPYGKITLRQASLLRKEYRLVMWDILSYDFDLTLSPEACLTQTLAGTRPGSIVVFHDNVKSVRLLQYVLPRYLEQVLGQGYNALVL